MTEPASSLDLYTAHQRTLVAYASRIVGDRARAEDVVHDAWLIFDRLPAKKKLGDPAAYLRRMVRNLALNALASLARRQRIHGEDFEAAARTIADSSPLPDSRLIDRQRLEQALACLASLPERQQIAIRMHRMEGFKMREIADHLGVSIALVHALIADGLVKCADSVEAEHRPHARKGHRA